MTERTPTTADDELPGLGARWRLLAQLPSGRSARVWVAEDLELERQVVLKVFPPCADAALRARGLVEISLGQRLRHERLVGIYDVTDVDGHLVAVMEWMAGGSLLQRLGFSGAQPVDLVVRWLGHALEALAYLHERHLVHRDIKPSNLLLDERDDLKVADLGLVGRFDRGSYLPATRAAIGTQGYMAPEQLERRDPAPSWDLYGLGVTVTELLAGARRTADDREGYPSIADRRPDCPLWLDQFIGRLAAPRELDRFSSAVEALAVLEVQRAS